MNNNTRIHKQYLIWISVNNESVTIGQLQKHLMLWLHIENECLS